MIFAARSSSFVMRILQDCLLSSNSAAADGDASVHLISEQLDHCLKEIESGLLHQ